EMTRNLQAAAVLTNGPVTARLAALSAMRRIEFRIHANVAATGLDWTATARAADAEEAGSAPGVARAAMHRALLEIDAERRIEPTHRLSRRARALSVGAGPADVAG